MKGNSEVPAFISKFIRDVHIYNQDIDDPIFGVKVWFSEREFTALIDHDDNFWLNYFEDDE